MVLEINGVILGNFNDKILLDHLFFVFIFWTRQKSNKSVRCIVGHTLNIFKMSSKYAICCVLAISEFFTVLILDLSLYINNYSEYDHKMISISRYWTCFAHTKCLRSIYAQPFAIDKITLHNLEITFSICKYPMKHKIV